MIRSTFIVCVVMISTACSLAATESQTTSDPLSLTPALTKTVQVQLVDFAFDPSSITINPGDTIHWIWQANTMSTTSVAGSIESWDSGIHNDGFTFDHTFTDPGTYNYYDVVHGFDNGDGTAGGESGTIIVQGLPEPASMGLMSVIAGLALSRRRR
ncbi:MAG TPA: PEP-CTERM sorting domain-containing protein [Tepidisphaeraceae bacterium]|jgi:plastocyanin